MSVHTERIVLRHHAACCVVFAAYRKTHPVWTNLNTVFKTNWIYRVWTSNIWRVQGSNRCEKRSMLEHQNASGWTSESSFLTACLYATVSLWRSLHSHPVCLYRNYWKSLFWLAVDQTVELLAGTPAMVVQNVLSVNQQCQNNCTKWVLCKATMIFCIVCW